MVMMIVSKGENGDVCSKKVFERLVGEQKRGGM